EASSQLLLCFPLDLLSRDALSLDLPRTKHSCGGSRTGGSLPRPEDKTVVPSRSSLPRAARLQPDANSFFSSGKARRSKGSRTGRVSPPGQRPEEKEEVKRECREMPPIRLKLRDMPRLQDGPAGGDDNSNVNKHRRAAAAGEPQQSSAGMAVGAGIAARTTEQLADAWRIWPVMTISAVHSTVKGWFTRMDAALLGLPRGLGPAVSSLIRLLSLAIAASIVTSVITRTSQDLLKLPSRASKAVGDPSSYTPGRHNWVAAPSRWDPHYCSVCSGAIAWNSDAGVRCQICGSHAHASCSKRAHKEGLGCKTLCSADVEMSHKRLYRPLEEAEDEDDDACLLPEPEEKPPPVMRHQWMRGSIDDSQPCAACGGSCAGSGATGQHGFSCAWCKLQVHEGCISRVTHTECSLGRHRRLILPPIAVLKDQPRKKR
ncbi:unnamed protein product, partial [Ectocarpus sp. 12 AP-2014]